MQSLQQQKEHATSQLQMVPEEDMHKTFLVLKLQKIMSALTR